MLIAVGSQNPVKVAAVLHAFQTVWPLVSWEVQGAQVGSDVSDQPMSDIESIQGARNRAQKSLRLFSAAYGVGLEGGIQKIGPDWFDCGWIIVVRHDGLEGLGSTARIITPPKMVAMIKKGQELGTVVDHFFGTQNTKQAAGHFGLMTNNAITRTSGYTDGVIMALVRFLHPELWV
jgi:inosine/xanthosine triphosphatase